MSFNRDVLNNNLIKYKRNINLFLQNQCMQKYSPPYMSILVTNKCNLRCKHCFYNTQDYKNSTHPDEMTLENYEKISKSMGLILKGIFSGGEPFLREDFADIVGLFQKNNKIIETSTSTNGQDTEKIVLGIEKILKNNPHAHFSLAFSLDGDEEHHDQIRGKGTFRQSIFTWKECRKEFQKFENFDMYVCSTINLINEQCICTFIRWCIDNLQPSMISLLKTRQHPRAGEILKNVNLDIYKECIETLDFEIEKGRMGNPNHPQTYITSSLCKYVYNTLYNQKRDYICYAGIHGGFINFNGDVGVCEVLEPIGNLKNYDYNFDELWRKCSGRRELAGKCKECRVCTHETEGILPSLLWENNGIILPD